MAKSPPRARDLPALYGPFLPGLLLPALALLALRLLSRDRAWADWFVWSVTSPVKKALAALLAPLPFSLAEALWAGAILALAAFLLWSLAVVVKSALRRMGGKKAHPLRRLLRRSLALLSALLMVYTGYTAGWGVNYSASDFSSLTGLHGRESSVQELYALTLAFGEKCCQLSDAVPRDGEGVFSALPEDTFQRSQGLYAALYEEFPLLDQQEAQARPMFFSRTMSWLGFTGFYFPFTGESLVNVDAPASLVPATILHELGHQRNIAREDECNFLAILAGLKCGDPMFQYSSALMGYIHLSNALFSADRTLWRESRALLNEAVDADLRYNTAYWDRFETPVAQAAGEVYTSFAQSYGQEEILKSYGRCVDLLVSYYIPQS